MVKNNDATTMTNDLADLPRSATPASDLSESRPAKKRKLRPPGEAFQGISGPADDPILHQGRSRTTPHIEASASATLVQTLQRAIEEVKSALTDSKDDVVHSRLTSSHAKSLDLHLSLSRPLQLWTGQRASFISACRAALAETSSFELSFASFDILTNDEKTRSFLVCEVGYGYEHLATLTSNFNDLFEVKHLPKYYAEPRFHVSIAWWLHDDKRMPSQDALKAINDKLSKELRKPILTVNNIKVKIGKDVTSIDVG